MTFKRGLSTALAMKEKRLMRFCSRNADALYKTSNDMDVLEIVEQEETALILLIFLQSLRLSFPAEGFRLQKHGNRAASSKCGAADVLEALGVNITVSPAQSAQMLKDINICFSCTKVSYSDALRGKCLKRTWNPYGI